MSYLEDLLTSKRKNKYIAATLAVALGFFGIHEFYLERNFLGLLLLLFCWTGIPFILGIISGVKILLTSKQDFDKRWNSNIDKHDIRSKEATNSETISYRELQESKSEEIQDTERTSGSKLPEALIKLQDLVNKTEELNQSITEAFLALDKSSVTKKDLQKINTLLKGYNLHKREANLIKKEVSTLATQWRKAKPKKKDGLLTSMARLSIDGTIRSLESQKQKIEDYKIAVDKLKLEWEGELQKLEAEIDF